MAWITFVLVLLFVASMGLAFYTRTYGGVIAMGLFLVAGGISLGKFGFPHEYAFVVNAFSLLVLVLCIKKKIVDYRKAKKPKSLQIEGGVVAQSSHGLR